MSSEAECSKSCETKGRLMSGMGSVAAPTDACLLECTALPLLAPQRWSGADSACVGSFKFGGPPRRRMMGSRARDRRPSLAPGHGRCVAALGGPVCQCEAGFERAESNVLIRALYSYSDELGG